MGEEEGEEEGRGGFAATSMRTIVSSRPARTFLNVFPAAIDPKAKGGGKEGGEKG